MIVVGELINASRKTVGRFIEERDVAQIQNLAVKQCEAGAAYIDVNAGIFMEKEREYLKWLTRVVQECVELSCCIDSPDPEAIEAALEVHRGPAPMINSISLEKVRYARLLPLLARSELKVVALCMSDEGMPETVKERLTVADRLINGLVQAGVKIENIFVDPLVQPLATRSDYGREFLLAVEAIHAGFPGVHTICGLSNISHGLPVRRLINQTFAVMAIAKGLDGLIGNPLDRRMMAEIRAAEAVVGRDNFCMKYLQAFRQQKLDA